MRTITLFTLSIALLLQAGCGNRDGNVFVTGEVRHNGELLPGAVVVFSPVDDSGESASGTTDEAGTFVLSTTTGNFGSGAKPGEYRVAISKRDVIWDGRSYIEIAGSEPVRAERAVEVLPREFGNPLQTPLRATVTNRASDNVFHFEIP
ncbi:MAG: carboxypeptidase-like regulatory domain-containing protein [Planctomycetaceae bacterium]|nr:carboxypeptidase-like regulatory domain-containing protein [Planctomycetaceae bacterium]